MEIREPGGWRRLAEPVRSHVRWTVCGGCGGRIRRVTVDPAGEVPGREDRFEHVAGADDAARCPTGDGVATPAVVTAPVPWHGPVVDAQLATILAGGPDGAEERFESIAPARGMPGDASAEVRREGAEDRAGFGHSHVTVRELLAYDWRHCITEEAFVVDRDVQSPAGGRAAKAEYWASRDHRLPSWAPAVTAGPDTVRVTWPWPAWAAAGHEFLVCMIRLAELAADDREAVRCVFWFAERDHGA